MRDSVTGIVVLALIVLTVVVHRQSETLKRIQRAASQTQTEGTLKQQGDCSKEAATTFKEGGFTLGGLDNFTDHYDPKRNRCFVEITSATLGRDSSSRTIVILDAYERKELGSFFENDFIGSQSTVSCTFSLDHQQCTSLDDFNRLAKAYMGD